MISTISLFSVECFEIYLPENPKKNPDIEIVQIFSILSIREREAPGASFFRYQ